MLDLDELEAKAKAATPGPWEAKEVWHAARLQADDCAVTALFWRDESNGGVHMRRLDPDRDGQLLLVDADFIAAANPAVVLDLIKDLREARAAVAAEREACARVCDEISSDYCTRELRRFAELRTDAEIGAGNCAAEIRARGEKGGE